MCRRSTCLRKRFGAVIVSKSDKIIATGYNGAIRKALDCLEIGKCMREELKIKSGERYELCKSFHAEQNAVLAADPTERRDGTLYLYGETFEGSPVDADPCMMCRRTIVQGELARVVAHHSDGIIKVTLVSDFVHEEDLGKNFPAEIRATQEFRQYMDKVQKLKGKK